VCVLHVSVLPAPGPARGRPEAPLHVSTRGSLRPGLAVGHRGWPCSGPEQCESGSLLSLARSGLCARWEVVADLCSLVLSFQWCADR